MKNLAIIIALLASSSAMAGEVNQVTDPVGEALHRFEVRPTIQSPKPEPSQRDYEIMSIPLGHDKTESSIPLEHEKTGGEKAYDLTFGKIGR